MRRSYPLGELYPSVQRALQYNGRYYALPRDTTTNLLFYNKTHLADAGIAYPTDNWTWADFTGAAKKLTRENRWGFVTDYFADGYYHWFSTNSADWFNEDRTTITIDSVRSVETMGFLRSLVYDYSVTPSRTVLAARGGGGARAFQQQATSMFVGAVANAYSWSSEKELSWDVAMIPKNTQLGSRIWANLRIPAGAKNVDAAWRVLSFFAGPDGQRVVLKMKTGIPGIRSLASSFDNAAEHKSYFFRAFDVGVPYPVITSDSMWTVFNDQMTKFWGNQISAREAADVIKKQGQPLM